jgi:hypothetical protein
MKFIQMKGGSRKYFTHEEDIKLQALVGQHGTNWKKIAESFNTRSTRQLKERYEGYLAPNISKEEWTADEDQLLVSKVKELGRKWKDISGSLDGRTNEHCKNRYRKLLKYEQKSGSFVIPRPEMDALQTPQCLPAHISEAQDNFPQQFDLFFLDFISHNLEDEVWDSLMFHLEF